MDKHKKNTKGNELHESTGAKGHENAPNPLVQLVPGLFLWTIITFTILCYVLAKFAWKPLLEALESRENTIKSSLEDAIEAPISSASLFETVSITSKTLTESAVIEPSLTAPLTRADPILPHPIIPNFIF